MFFKVPRREIYIEIVIQDILTPIISFFLFLFHLIVCMHVWMDGWMDGWMVGRSSFPFVGLLFREIGQEMLGVRGEYLKNYLNFWC